ncbi:MAG: hypothetical protein AAGA23_10105 [Pseudomonadota bacterium]
MSCVAEPYTPACPDLTPGLRQACDTCRNLRSGLRTAIQRVFYCWVYRRSLRTRLLLRLLRPGCG